MPDPVAASLRIAPEALTRPFSAEQFSFSTTNDLEPFRGVLGQERAVEALQFGVAMPRPGYNVFVMGEPGTGRFSFVKRYLKAEGKRLQTPSDWVYVNHFDEPREPARWSCHRAARRPSSPISAAWSTTWSPPFPRCSSILRSSSARAPSTAPSTNATTAPWTSSNAWRWKRTWPFTVTAPTSPSPRCSTARPWTKPNSPSCRRPTATASTRTSPTSKSA